MGAKGIAKITLALTAAVLLVAVVLPTGSSYTLSDSDAPKGLPDTLRIATLSGPSTFFIYREEPMGADYEMAMRFALRNKMALRVSVAKDEKEMETWLKQGKVDLIACHIDGRHAKRNGLRLCGPKSVSDLVIVQPKGKDAVKRAEDLQGHTAFVEKDSRYQYRIQELNDSIGGGIGIEAVCSDTISATDLAVLVARGDVPLTVADSDVARACATKFKNLDIETSLSANSQGGWAVKSSDKALAKALDNWYALSDEQKQYEELRSKYLSVLVDERDLALSQIDEPEWSDMPASAPQLASSRPSTSSRRVENKAIRPAPKAPALPKVEGAASQYDHLFKRHAASIGWDWRQLAAIGFTESHFNPNAVSWAGAKGIMQLMPGTAKKFGASQAITDPNLNIGAGARFLESLETMFSKSVHNPKERRLMVIAAYNSGPGHIIDAMALAKKYGRDPEVWENNVCEMLKLKSKPKYYKDPVVRSGYFEASETTNFVRKVMATYEHYRQSLPPS